MPLEPSLLPRFIRPMTWVLLGIALVTEILVPRTPYGLQGMLLIALVTAGLALFNCATPQDRLTRTLYILAEVSLTTALIYLSSLRFAPLLYLLIITKSRFLLGRRAAYATGGLALVLFVVQGLRMTALNLGPGSEFRARLLTDGSVNDLAVYVLITLAALFVMAIFFVLSMSEAMVRERESRTQAEQLSAQLEQANQQLRAYSLQAEVLAATQERNRIAREIHDSLGHYLTAMNLQLDAGMMFLQRQQPERADPVFHRVKSLSSEALQEVRRSIKALRSSRLEGKTLPEILRELVAEAQDLSIDLSEPPLLTNGYREEAVAALYRILQEALTNTRKYAQANRITVQFSLDEKWLQVYYQDDGLGTDPTRLVLGYGLEGIRERAQALGGWAVFCSAPGAGFALGLTLARRYVERELPTP